MYLMIEKVGNEKIISLNSSKFIIKIVTSLVLKIIKIDEDDIYKQIYWIE